MFNKILYIGSGLHLEPLVQFETINEFIFIDTQPRSEFDKPNYFCKQFYRNRFYFELIKKMNLMNFNLKNTIELNSNYCKNFSYLKNEYPDICPKILIFVNNITGKKLKYYISTNILYNMCEELENDLKTANGLIISGHHPDKNILEYIKHPINLYCYDKTCYKLEEDEIDDKNNLIYWMFNNITLITQYFSNIYLVKYIDEYENDFIKNDFIKYDSFEELSNDVKKIAFEEIFSK